MGNTQIKKILNITSQMEMQIKPTMKYHLTIVRMATIKKDKKLTSVGGGVEKREPSCIVDGNVNLCSHQAKQYEVSQKIKNRLPYDPAIPFLGIYPKESITLIQKDMLPYIHSSVIYDSQSTEATQFPRINELIKKIWCIYTMEYYLAIRNKILLFVTVWMDVEGIVQSEIEKKNTVFHLYV